ncbi:hypothetical protein CC86DRAFT_304094, partial [Ophiobolus disseminans]
PGTIPMFFKLPTEIRDRIYTFALVRGRWNIQNVTSFDTVNLPGGIGDLGGFYFPLSRGLEVLLVNRQMRQEALPLAYRTTSFHLDDLDDLLKLLIAVGDSGRQNIESAYFPWESRSDLERKWDETPDADDHSLQLPNLHVAECVKLLEQCRRLRFIRLYIEHNLMDAVDPEVFKTDPGI